MRINQRLLAPALAGAAVFATAPAQAVVVSGTLSGGSALSNGGSFVIVTSFPPGFAVGGNDFGNNNVRAFNEVQDFVLLSALAVRGGSIAAGTKISSHVVNFDPATSRRAIGSVKFDSPILGVATTRNLLVASNYLGRPDVTYSFVNASGLEGNDSVTFSGDVLSFDLTASNPSDSFRVITAGRVSVAAAVPEPAVWAAMIAGFGLAGAMQRRRRQLAMNGRRLNPA
jgi:hypothetical protein